MKKVFILFTAACIFMSSSNVIYADTVYTVKRGDTLWNIALRFEIGLGKIIDHNPQILNPNLIFPGQMIIIPSAILRKNEMTTLSNNEKEILELINSKRKELGLKPLILDDSLTKAAKQKSIDMMEKQYVSHISPTYGDSRNMLKTFNISYDQVKESIGAGYGSPGEIFSLWMNTSVNQSNMLDKMSTHIGIGYVAGGLHGHYWTVFIIQRNEGGK